MLPTTKASLRPRLHANMAYLVCKLTPPRKGSEMSHKSPSDFLTSAEAMSPLKRKAHFSRLSSESLKKFRLDPAPVLGDSTITIYHERTQALMPEDRDKIHVQIPFESELEHVRELQVFHQDINNLLKYTDPYLSPRLENFEPSSRGLIRVDLACL